MFDFISLGFAARQRAGVGGKPFARPQCRSWQKAVCPAVIQRSGFAKTPLTRPRDMSHQNAAYPAEGRQNDTRSGRQNDAREQTTRIKSKILKRKNDMTFEEKIISSERIYEGAIINLRRDEVTVQNGTSYREIIEHNGGAVLAAVTDEGKMVMVRQYRKPAGRVMLEVPAGKIDSGEEPLSAAIRELKEETGYTATEVKFMTSFYPSVGYSEEVLYLYLCTGLEQGEPDPDENEAIDIEEMDVEDLFSMIMKGRINDAKTLVAVMMVREEIASGKLPVGRK